MRRSVKKVKKNFSLFFLVSLLLVCGLLLVSSSNGEKGEGTTSSSSFSARTNVSPSSGSVRSVSSTAPATWSKFYFKGAVSPVGTLLEDGKLVVAYSDIEVDSLLSIRHYFKLAMISTKTGKVLKRTKFYSYSWDLLENISWIERIIADHFTGGFEVLAGKLNVSEKLASCFVWRIGKSLSPTWKTVLNTHLINDAVPTPTGTYFCGNNITRNSDEGTSIVFGKINDEGTFEWKEGFVLKNGLKNLGFGCLLWNKKLYIVGKAAGDVAIAKVDPITRVVVEKRYADLGDGAEDWLDTLMKVSGTDLFIGVGGMSQENDEGESRIKGLLVLFNSSLQVVYHRVFNSFQITHISACPDGNFLLSGSTSAFDDSEKDAVLMKFDPRTRKVLWKRVFAGNDEDEGKFAYELPDGSIIFGGYTKSSDFPTADGSTFDSSEGYTFLLKLKPDGTY